MNGGICPNMELNLPLQLHVREIKFIRNFKTIKTTDVKKHVISFTHARISFWELKYRIKHLKQIS